MAYQLQEINRRAKLDPKGFVEESDYRFQERIQEASNHIVENLSKSPIVLVSGPSSSGKTTTALKIEEELKTRGINSHTISMDNYFVDMNPETAPRTERGDIDYESPLCLDMKLLNAHFTKLAKGEEILVPQFEFARQRRNREAGTPLQLKSNEIAIFEGIHALNDDIAGRNPEATGLYISAQSNVVDGEDLRFKGSWMRLIRRAIRDYNFRGTGVGDTLNMWTTVRRGEKLYITPFKDKANLRFDSSLPYEVSVMRNFAKPLLKEVPEDNSYRKQLLELIQAFEYFEPIDPKLVPRDSLLREFLGGGQYEYQ